MLAQLLNNQNKHDTTSTNHYAEENLNNKPLNTERPKEGSSIDVEVIKGIQAHIVSLTQRDELKKVGMIRPYPSKWDSFHIHWSSSHLRCTRMMARASQISISITFGLKSSMWQLMMLSWSDYSITPSWGSLWLVQKPSQWLHQLLGWLRNSVSFSILHGW